jgi:hypothetical protein
MFDFDPRWRSLLTFLEFTIFTNFRDSNSTLSFLNPDAWSNSIWWRISEINSVQFIVLLLTMPSILLTMPSFLYAAAVSNLHAISLPFPSWCYSMKDSDSLGYTEKVKRTWIWGQVTHARIVHSDFVVEWAGHRLTEKWLRVVRLRPRLAGSKPRFLANRSSPACGQRKVTGHVNSSLTQTVLTALGARTVGPFCVVSWVVERVEFRNGLALCFGGKQRFGTKGSIFRIASFWVYEWRSRSRRNN